MLPLSVALHSLQPVTRWDPQIIQADRGIQNLQLVKRLLLYGSGQFPAKFPLPDPLGFSTLKVDYQPQAILHWRIYPSRESIYFFVIYRLSAIRSMTYSFLDLRSPLTKTFIASEISAYEKIPRLVRLDLCDRAFVLQCPGSRPEGNQQLNIGQTVHHRAIYENGPHERR